MSKPQISSKAAVQESRRGGRSAAHASAGVIAAAALAGLAPLACSHDWDIYDPRLQSGGAAGQGGTGAAGAAGASGGTESSGASAGSAGASGGSGGTMSSSSSGGTGGSTSSGGSGGSVTQICMPSSMMSCYDGPAGSNGKGVCKSGQMTCDMDGLSYGPCLGQVTPLPEECGKVGDEDCDGVEGEHCGIWARQFGTSGDQAARGLALDGAGNVIVVGAVSGSVDFGAGVLTSAGGKDAFVTKLDSTGKVVWSKLIGDALEQEAVAVAVDGAGNIVVTGYFEGSVSFNGGMPPVHTAEAMGDIFVVKYDSAGGYLWSDYFPGLGVEYGVGAAFDGNGDIYLSGSFGGITSFGPGMPSVPFEAMDGFLLKLPAAGGPPLWVKTFGEAGDDEGTAIVTTPAGHVILAGYFDERIDFGGGSVTDGGSHDVFVAELTGDGGYVFAKAYGGLNDQFAHTLSRDASGNLLVAGDFYTSANFGGGLMMAGGTEDMFVVKLSPSGGHLWTRTFGDAEAQEHTQAAFSPGGDVVFAVSMYGTVDFGGGALSAAAGSGSDVVIGKLKGSNGAYSWARRFGDGPDQDARAIVTDSMGNIYAAGEFAGKLDFGTSQSLKLDNVSLDDIWVAKVEP